MKLKTNESLKQCAWDILSYPWHDDNTAFLMTKHKTKGSPHEILRKTFDGMGCSEDEKLILVDAYADCYKTILRKLKLKDKSK